MNSFKNKLCKVSAKGVNCVSIRPLGWTFMTVLLIGVITTATFGQPIVDASSMNFTPNNQTTITVPHTTGAGSNRLMLVGVSNREQDDLSATYNGLPLDVVGSEISNGGANTHIFSLLNPPTGTFNVVVTTNGDFDQGGVVGVMTFTNVNLADPLNTYTELFGNSGDPTLPNIPTASNELIFNVVAFQNRELSGPGAGQTQIWYQASGDDIRGGGSTEPGDVGPATMSWLRVLTNNENWSMSAVSIKPTLLADLQIAKVVNITEPYVGQIIQFTLTATNPPGGSNAPNVLVQDLLPSGYNYISHSTGTGNYSGETGIWSLGTLNANTSATLTITASVNGSGTYTNTASIAGDVSDNNTGNNSASVSVTVCQAGGTKPLFNN